MTRTARRLGLSFAALLGAAVLRDAGVAHAGTDSVAAVKAAGVLHCASSGAQDDITRDDTHGDVSDLADEICKAVAVAVLGPTGKADLHVWPDEQQVVAAVRDGHAELAIGPAPRLETAMAFHLAFGPAVFHDGQGFMAEAGITSAADLEGKKVCFLEDASVGEALAAYMQGHGVTYIPFPFQEMGELLSAAAGGLCAAVSANISQLINMRVGFAPVEKRFTVLPIRFTNDPVATAFRADDRAWALVVNAVVNVLIEAEAKGVTRANADAMARGDDPAIQDMSGPQRRAGHLIGLPDAWALTVLKKTGNYGEIYERTLGAGSEFKLPRGPNRPVTAGGEMYAPPLY